jgi:tripartite ATP-independent transporter DctP family solute receptor
MCYNKLAKILCVITLLPIFSCIGTSDKKELKLAHALQVGHPVHQAMEYMARRVGELSEGKLMIKVYPAEQLGSEKQCVELLQIGSLAMTKVSAAVLEGFIDDYKVFGLPYLFKSKEHIFKILDGEIGKELLLSTEIKWIRGLCYYDAGSRSFYTISKSINNPDDLSGMKMRVQPSITAIEMIKALGGSATPISYGELYTALQSGVVDGAENSPTSLYISRHYEVCKFFSLDEHTTIPDILVISKVIWDKLSSQEQLWVQQAADESALLQRELWAKSEIESIVKLQEAGVLIYYPEKEPFIQKVQSLLESYESNPVIYSYIKRIQAVK